MLGQSGSRQTLNRDVGYGRVLCEEIIVLAGRAEKLGLGGKAGIIARAHDARNLRELADLRDTLVGNINDRKSQNVESWARVVGQLVTLVSFIVFWVCVILAVFHVATWVYTVNPPVPDKLKISQPQSLFVPSPAIIKRSGRD
jgi:hypothetical protein